MSSLFIFVCHLYLYVCQFQLTLESSSAYIDIHWKAHTSKKIVSQIARDGVMLNLTMQEI